MEPRSFDDFNLRLGDTMRGERATMGKSLLDVQRELRIKAAYIAAIENCDPSAFDTPGFIAGYVRSYARYLNMDPDIAFTTFCQESGFSVAHGMSAEASVVKKQTREDRPMRTGLDKDPFGGSGSPFAPEREAIWTQLEPRAIGSSLVLVALIGGLGYGGWSLLREVQQVQVTPVDQTPVVLSDLDPLAGAGRLRTEDRTPDYGTVGPSAEALDRLYRPQALDVPVLVARDAPIATLDPRKFGSFTAPDLPQTESIIAGIARDGTSQSVPQVVETAAKPLQMVAVREAWVRVRSADGSVVFEGIMQRGQTYVVPLTEEPPTLRVGDAGAIYFEMQGQHFGPVGSRGAVTSNVALSMDSIADTYSIADLEQDRELARVVADASAAQQSGN